MNNYFGNICPFHPTINGLNFSKFMKPQELLKNEFNGALFMVVAIPTILNASYQTSNCIHMQSNFFRGRSILRRGNKMKHTSAEIIMSAILMHMTAMKTKEGKA